MRVVWSSYAARQAVDAFDYLALQRPGSGTRFKRALRTLTSRVGRFPRAYPRSPAEHRGEIRNALIRPYGYWVIYAIEDETVVILAIWPAQREPGGWQVH